MPGTETWDIADAGGARYRVFVSRPSGPPPAEGYPILYVLDVNPIFASFAEARAFRKMPPGRSAGRWWWVSAI